MTKSTSQEPDKYLIPGEFIDSDHPDIQDFVREFTDSEMTEREKVIAMYYVIRDRFRYDPYRLDFSKEAMKSSHLLTRDYGYCVEKSSLMAASCRCLGIPSRMGFAKVRNHLGTEKLERILQTDELVFHGYAEIYLEGQWIKVTPVFNKELCEKMDVEPLGFDGHNDAIFQSYNRNGNQFMEYLFDYGTFADIPYELFMNELAAHYPHLVNQIIDLKFNI